MLVSIIVPAHNESVYIDGLLKTLFSCVDSDIEVIVVDNGSVDKTSTVAENYACKVISLPQKVYPSKARNVGVEAASGEYLVFLDADIEVSIEWGHQLKCLLAGQLLLPELFVTGAPYCISQSPSWLEKFWFGPLSKKTKSYINGGNIITTREAFDALGGFDLELETGEDVDFCLRASNSGIEVVIDDAWKVFHEGFPKTVKRFVGRERWHGKGDFIGLRNILSSKIALATCVYITLHVLLLVSLIGEGETFYALGWGALFLISLLCVARAVKDIGVLSLKSLFVCTFISYLYFFGRAQSPFVLIIDRLNRVF